MCPTGPLCLDGMAISLPGSPLQLPFLGSPNAERFRWDGKGLRSRCFCKPRSERGAGRHEARNEQTTKDLCKQIEQARLIPMHHSGRATWDILEPSLAGPRSAS